jgi:hypothetical protein
MTGFPTDADLARLQRRAFVVGAVALLASAGGAMFDPRAFLGGWLASFLFWLGIPLGCLVIIQLHYLSGGAWGIVVRRVAESAAATIPVLALAFVPLAFGLRLVFVWARPEAVAAAPDLQEKAAYLNVPFFLARALVYFAAWTAVASVLRRWSLRRDETPDPNPRRFRIFAGPGLVVYGLTVTFAAIDWGMSVDPHWYSTAYPVIFGIGQVVSGFAFSIALAMSLREREPFGRLVRPANLIDLGNLLLTFVLLWAYVSFAQFMLIWAGNIREETTWYLAREAGGWLAVALVLIGAHFALPFALLLHRPLKRDPRTLAAIALLVLAMRLLDCFWLVVPGIPGAHAFHWLYLTTPLAIGGLWAGAFVWRLRGVPLVPGNEPLVEHAMTAHGH